MTTKDLSERVDIRLASGYDSYRVTVYRRGKRYDYISHDTAAYDIIKSGEPGVYKTRRQALQALWDKCKEKFYLR